jgi:hypothetical protein
MTRQSNDCERLEGSEAFGLYLTEIASSVSAISQQSALLLQALSERAVLLADMAVQPENTGAATDPTTGEARQCCEDPAAAGSLKTSASAAANDKTTVL